MGRRGRDILEDAVRRIAEQAANTNEVIDDAMEAGLAPDHPVTIAAKQVRLELLKVKADLERELGKLVLNCSACGMEVHWVQGSAWRTQSIGGIASRRRTGSQWSSSSPGLSPNTHS